jgi:hypothetical protein
MRSGASEAREAPGRRSFEPRRRIARLRIDISMEDEDADAKRAKRRKRAVERMSGGLVAALAWAAAYFLFFRSRWMLFPFLFMGLVPLVSGMKELLAERLEAPARRRAARTQDRGEVERGILRLARDREGRVSPALVSIETGIDLETAQAALDDMTRRGHASLRVLESGRLEYEFPEFAPLSE